MFMDLNALTYEQIKGNMETACTKCEKSFNVAHLWESTIRAGERHGYFGKTDDELFQWRLDFVSSFHKERILDNCRRMMRLEEQEEVRVGDVRVCSIKRKR